MPQSATCAYLCVCERECACVSPQQGQPRVCGAEPSHRQAPHGVKWQPPGHHWLMTVKTLAVNIKRGSYGHSQMLHLRAALTAVRRAPRQVNSAVLQQNVSSQQQLPQTFQARDKRGEHTIGAICHNFGNKGCCIAQIVNIGVKVEHALWLWSKSAGNEPLDCHKCHPRSDKVRTKCLATAEEQSYKEKVWENDPASLSTAVSPQH